MSIIKKERLGDFFENPLKKHSLIGEIMVSPSETVLSIILTINETGGLWGKEKISQNIFFENYSQRSHARLHMRDCSISFCFGHPLPETFPEKEKRGMIPVRLALHKP
jgi:hypothetical protein